MALAIAVVTFAACSSDDDKYVADVNLPAGTEKTADADILVEAGAHEFTLNIKTEGKWIVTSENRFLRVQNAEGTGNGTVTVAVQNNRSDDRKLGTLDITFPGHESENKTITVEQKYLGDYGGNADIINKGNQVYAVGYSYDTTGEWANPNSVMKQVFDTKHLIEREALSLGPVQMSLRKSTVTGSTMSEISDQLSAKASVKGSYAGFTGEVGASFDMSHAESSNYEYAITYIDYTIARAQLTMSVGSMKKEYMMDDAYRAINGLDPDYASNPDNQDGIKRLISEYGTHVIMSADLGGRVRSKMEVDITKITSSYDINAYVEASYDGVVEASGRVENDYKQSFQSNKNAVKLTADVLGGEKTKADSVGSTDGFTKKNVDAWQQSVDSLNMALINFDEKSLLPLYELVDQSIPGGPERYKELFDYLESGLAKDQSGYFCGTTFKFDVPTFDDKYNSTLVKDVYLDGQWVGRICNEYVPKVNIDSRVTVIYPVINNKPRYNMGFYLGDGRSHKPARVSWSTAGESLYSYEDLKFENVKTVYMRGTSIKSVPPKNTTVVPTDDIRDAYLKGLRMGNNGNKESNYPIVKIFNKVWTRSDYCRGADGNVGRDLKVKQDGDDVDVWAEYYPPTNVINTALFPIGWSVASQSDFFNMWQILTATNQHPLPGLALLNGGVTGFNVYFLGWYDCISNVWANGDFHMEYFTKDLKHVAIRSDGLFLIQDGDASNWKMCVRLVQD